MERDPVLGRVGEIVDSIGFPGVNFDTVFSLRSCARPSGADAEAFELLNRSELGTAGCIFIAALAGVVLEESGWPVAMVPRA